MIHAGAKTQSGGMKSGLTSPAYHPDASGEMNSEASANAPKTSAKEKMARKIFFMGASRKVSYPVRVSKFRRAAVSVCRDAENRTRATSTPCLRTTTIRHPAQVKNIPCGE